MKDKKDNAVVVAIGGLTPKGCGKMLGELIEAKGKHAPGGYATIALVSANRGTMIEKKEG